jgi:GTPase SAR1 family protein
MLKTEFGTAAEFFGAVLVALYAVAFAVFFARYIQRRNSPAFRSYRVSIVGPPGAGKTTAILCLLDQAVRRNGRGLVRLRGENTISRLEAGMVALNAGSFPSRTEEDSTNIYRFDYRIFATVVAEAFLIALGSSNYFRVEVADFAGEHTESFLNSDKKSTKENIPDEFSVDAGQNFLKWVSESDVCVLFIDIQKWLSHGEKYRDFITTKYMAFWQRYLDLHVDIIRRKAGASVVLAFSKIDMIGANGSEVDSVSTEAYAKSLSYEFSTLVDFLKNNSKNLEVVAFSSISRLSNQDRIGINQFLDAILPRMRRSTSR